MSFLKGYNNQKNQEQLQATREQNLATAKFNLEKAQYAQGRVEQKDNFTDKKRQSAEDLLTQAQQAQNDAKTKLNSVAVDELDKSIETAFKGDLEPLKRIFTNSTKGNLNNDLKSTLEESIGGKIIDVRHPTADDTPDGETHNPDQLAVSIITDTGEQETHLMSLGQLGGMVGTSSRIGHSRFTELASGKHKKATPTDNALLSSLNFDGTISNLKENLVLAGTVGKDKDALALLNNISEVSAKDGESLLKALTAEYGKAKDPKEKKALLAKITDTANLIEKIKKKTATSKTTTTKDKLAQQIIEGTASGKDMSKQKDLYKELYGKAGSTKPTKAQEKATELNEKRTAVHKVVDNPEVATLDDISRAVELSKSANSTDASRASDIKAMGRQFIANGGGIDLSSESARVGEVTAKDKANLAKLQLMEDETAGIGKDSYLNKARTQIANATNVMQNANEVVRDVDLLKTNGVFTEEGLKNSGVWKTVSKGVTSVLDGVIGLHLGTREETTAKFKEVMGSMETKLDEFNTLKSKGSKLTKDERVRLANLQQDLQINFKEKWDTQTYLTLKKMLQSISGMGVTNTELESFKSAFVGGDLTALNYMVAKVKSSAVGFAKQSNSAFNTLISQGAYASAYKGVLGMRSAGKYMLTNDSTLNIGSGINKVNRVNPVKEQYKEHYPKMIGSITKATGASKALVGDVIDKFTDLVNTMPAGNRNYLSEFHKRYPLIPTDTAKVIIQSLKAQTKAIDAQGK